MSFNEKVLDLLKSVDPNAFYVICFSQILDDGERQRFYVTHDLSGVNLTRNHRKAFLFNSDKDNIRFFVKLAYNQIIMRTNQSAVVSSDMDYPAWVGEWVMELIPCELRYDDSHRAGFVVKKEETITDGYVHPSILRLAEEGIKPSSPILDMPTSAAVDVTVVKQLNKGIRPDFFEGFTILTKDDVLTMLRTYEWQNAEKVRAAGQHAVRQKKQHLVYEFGINGVIHQEVMHELHAELSEQGWSGVSTAVTGQGSASWTRLMLHRKVDV